MSILNDFRVNIGDDDSTALSGVSPPSVSVQTIGPDLGLLIRDLRVDSGDDESVDFASGITVGSLPSIDIIGPDILTEIRDLRVDTGDDEGLVLPSGSGMGSLPSIIAIGPSVLDLLRDFRVDIGDDAGINFPLISGVFPSQGPVCWNTTFVGSMNYDVDVDDVILLVSPTTPTTTINLPAAPSLGCILIIKDVAGTAFARNIIVDPSPNTIDGFTTWRITQNKQSIMITWNGTEWGII